MKKSRNLSALIIALFVSVSLFGQATDTVFIGNGSNISSSFMFPSPYGNWFNGAKHQVLIRASELAAAGMAPGDITTFAFNVFATNTSVGDCGSLVPLDDFTIKMKLTSVDILTNNFETGLSTVWGPQDHTDSVGWNIHTLTSPFYWDGISNLIVETCFNNTCFTGNDQIYFTPAGFSGTSYYYTNTNTVCASTFAYTPTVNRPDMRFESDPASIPPVTSFGVDQLESCSGTFTFMDFTAGDIDQRMWDFGDGNTDTVANPTHAYATPGTYTVTLITHNAFGYDTLVRTDFVEYRSSLGIPYQQPFPNGSSDLDDFIVIENTESEVRVTSVAAKTGPDGLAMGGNTFASWITPSQGNEFTTNPEHLASASLCIDATSATSLGLIFDLKLIYQYVDNYTNFRVTVDGNQIGNTYQPQGITSDWITQNLDLSAYVGGVVEIKFESSCRYAYDNGGPDMGNGVYIDNIVVKQITDPPVADFTVSDTLACNGSLTVNFEDRSVDFPDTWLWNFGDGNTSNLQNPVHTYISTGVYTVTLTASNQHGQNTMTKTDLIEVTNASPAAASCIPNNGYFNDAGIYQVQVDSTFEHNSGNGIEGYQDYVCTQIITITAGVPTPIKVVTGPTYDEYVRAWIDFDNNGVFDDPAEMVFDSEPKRVTHLGTLMLPQNVTYNTLLRMRVMSEWGFGVPPTPCGNITTGQIEDYSVIIEENMLPPEAGFSGTPLNTCSGLVKFSDNSFNFPTSWEWDFGDGNTSNQENPSHTYAFPDTGSYTVSLIVCNPYGCDTIVLDKYVDFNYGAADPNCVPAVVNAIPNVGIFEVHLNTIHNVTLDGMQEGYYDQACTNTKTTLIEGVSYDISILTGTLLNENVRVWIDYDNSLDFDPVTELVLASDDKFIYHDGNFTVPSGTVHDIPIRMRVASTSDLLMTPDPCATTFDGQVEDYTVTVISNQIPPITSFESENIGNCTGEMQFTDKSINQASSWLWDFGDSTTSNVQHPVHTYSVPGHYDVTLITTNTHGSDTLVESVLVAFNYADFLITPNPVQVGEPVSFTNKSYDYDELDWNFGDGNSSSLVHPDHVYTETGAYNVRLTVENDEGCSHFKVAAVQVADLTGIGAPAAVNELRIYPNPTQGQLNLSYRFEGQGDISLSVINVLGETMLQSQHTESFDITVNMSAWAKGIYLVKIVQGKEQLIRKIELY